MIGVVFVNFHSEALIARRLRVLQRADVPVVVVDNSGTFPPAPERIDAGCNLGFAAACNLGVEALPAEVDVVCFHNPDVEIELAGIDRLAVGLAAQPVPGVVAPAERTPSALRPCGYRYPSVLRELGLSLRGAPRVPAERREHLSARRSPCRGRRFGGGGLLVASRTAHQAIGGFDERYFLYAEDLDYWDRMIGGGRSATFDGGVIAEHRMGTGSPLDRDRRELLRWVGVELFTADRGGPWRTMREIHRRALALRRESGALASALGALWDERQAPETVAATLLPRLRSGELLRRAP